MFNGNSQCSHWFTISTITLKPGYVSTYDSLNQELDSNVQNQICAFLKNEGTTITVNKVPVQQQHGSVDCGLFVITNSVALCFGHEPNKLIFRYDKLRSHLVSCLESGQFTMFPLDVNVRQKKKTQKRVYCTCRRAHDGSPMIRSTYCNEWFHKKVCICRYKY